MGDGKAAKRIFLFCFIVCFCMCALDNRCQKRGLIVHIYFFFQHIDMNSYFKQRVKQIKIVSDSNDYMPASVNQKKKYKINKAAC